MNPQAAGFGGPQSTVDSQWAKSPPQRIFTGPVDDSYCTVFQYNSALTRTRCRYISTQLCKLLHTKALRWVTWSLIRTPWSSWNSWPKSLSAKSIESPACPLSYCSCSWMTVSISLAWKSHFLFSTSSTPSSLPFNLCPKWLVTKGKEKKIPPETVFSFWLKVFCPEDPISVWKKPASTNCYLWKIGENCSLFLGRIW